MPETVSVHLRPRQPADVGPGRLDDIEEFVAALRVDLIQKLSDLVHDVTVVGEIAATTSTARF